MKQKRILSSPIPPKVAKGKVVEVYGQIVCSPPQKLKKGEVSGKVIVK